MAPKAVHKVSLHRGEHTAILIELTGDFSRELYQKLAAELAAALHAGSSVFANRRVTYGRMQLPRECRRADSRLIRKQDGNIFVLSSKNHSAMLQKQLLERGWSRPHSEIFDFVHP